MGEIEEFIEEERDRRAVRAWLGNSAFFAGAVIGVIALVLIVGGTVVG